MKKLLITILISTLYFNLQAQEGKWSGELKFGTNKLEMIFNITKEGANYHSTISVPIQGVKELKMDSTYFSNDSLYISNKKLNMSYTGLYRDTVYEGKFSQNGMKFNLNLCRVNSNESGELKRPQTPKPPYPYKEEEIEFKNKIDGNTLSGTLTTPNGKGKFPVVVLVSGSGAQNRDEELFGHKPFLVLADFLTRNGVAVLRYDDRGVGKSDKTEKVPTTADLAYDAQAAMEYLNKRKEFSKIGVAGHSEGGLIAFMLAGEKGYKRPDFIISMAGTGVSGREILLKQQEDAMKKIGVPDMTIKQAIAQNSAIFTLIRESEQLDSTLVKSIKDSLTKFIPAGMNSAAAQKQIEKIVKEYTSPWLYFFSKYEPQKAISSIRIPVLAINGTLDTQVDANQNLTAIESALKGGKNKRYSIKYMDGLNHLFQTAKSGDINEYAQIEETMATEFMESVLAWINEIK